MKSGKWSIFILSLWGVSILVVVVGSVIPKLETPVNFWNIDKVYHFIAYAWLALLPVLGFARRRPALISALSMILLGILMEIIQYFIPTRSFSLLDITANTLGVITGLYVGIYIRNRLK